MHAAAIASPRYSLSSHYLNQKNLACVRAGTNDRISTIAIKWEKNVLQPGCKEAHLQPRPDARHVACS
jgi:hypothetical protein